MKSYKHKKKTSLDRLYTMCLSVHFRLQFLLCDRQQPLSYLLLFKQFWSQDDLERCNKLDHHGRSCSKRNVSPAEPLGKQSYKSLFYFINSHPIIWIACWKLSGKWQPASKDIPATIEVLLAMLAIWKTHIPSISTYKLKILEIRKTEWLQRISRLNVTAWLY